MRKFIPLIIIFLFVQIIKSNAQELWGMSYWGGLNNAGVIMNITEDTGGFAFPYSFGTPTGEFPKGSLLYNKDSIFYGLTSMDGADSEGVFFSYNPLTGVYNDLMDFDSSNGSFPYGSLVADTTGRLYGMTSAGGLNNVGVIFSYNPKTGVDSPIHYFDIVNGANPYGNLLLLNKDTTYGLTSAGGINDDGVIFMFNPVTHNFTKLYDFNDTTGMMPTGSLVKVNNRLYGMTSQGGANDDGVIFAYDLITNSYIDLFDFNYSNGSNPYGSFVLASNGKLYGMAENGVDSISDGVLFSYDPDSSIFSLLYVFSDSIGSNPAGCLIQGINGKLYGMTQQGGLFTDGVIFSYNIDSNVYTDMYDLNNAGGGNPCGDLVETPLITGISVISKTNFSIFPNPSQGLIYIISQNNIGAIRVTNLLGQTIYTSTPNQNRFTVNLNQESGMYFITLTSGNQIITKKIIINK